MGAEGGTGANETDGEGNAGVWWRLSLGARRLRRSADAQRFVLCPNPAIEPEPEDEPVELELDPPPELEDEPVELDELEELEELDELDEAEELELDELLAGVDELLEAPELLPVDEPVLDPPGPVRAESAPHPGSETTPASTVPPERRRRKPRRSSRDDCFARRREFGMIYGVCQLRGRDPCDPCHYRPPSADGSGRPAEIVASDPTPARDIPLAESEEIPAPPCPACGAVMESNLAACFSCGHVRRSLP